jgi:hypothetical protein
MLKQPVRRLAGAPIAVLPNTIFAQSGKANMLVFR